MGRTNQPEVQHLEYGNHGDDEDSDYDSCDESVSNSSEEEDPSFSIAKEEANVRLSKLSIKKPRARHGDDDESCKMEVSPQPLDVKDEERFEKIQAIINERALERLKVDECKIYLRKHGLRLTGKKNVLIARIEEHLEIKDGAGEKLYPQASFVLNCKGDSCTGDVVLFEQNVYDMYSIISRSATAPPCGTRLVAGRIVKESYGAAKQQHTFTIEVLWSRGVKPLPPLHPLLIKGRNLYKLKTMRQRWPDEMERQKILEEKHARGSRARFSREVRVQEREARKKSAAGNSKVKQDNIPFHPDKFPHPFSKNHHSFHGNTDPVRRPLQSLNPSLPPFHNSSFPPPLHQQQIQNAELSWYCPENRKANEEIPFHQENFPYTSRKNHNPFQGNCGQVRQPLQNVNFLIPPLHQQQMKKAELCRHFPRGRCFYGDSCRFIHEQR